MKVSMITNGRVWLSLLVGVLLAGCDRPFVLLPGGALHGALTPTPGSWAFTDDVGTVQLETNAADPYSVNIWVIGMGEHLYVHAGASRSTWVENMEADPKVRMGIEGAIYELTATRVESQEEFDRFSEAYEKKYGNPPRNPSVKEAYLFRLAAR
jgi:nitroimidazol reductase NimA-like FMN-containing flavoprotein (pyridoxamine 5'-phosphate oxidase superfamily)